MFLHKLRFLFLLFGISTSAQPNTEVYLTDISISDENVVVSNVINISNDPGYDNQPSFQSDNLVIFAGNNNGQTDIAQYNIRFKKKFWYHQGSTASQYSPQLIPNSQNVLAVHLDTNGRQRLYEHHITLLTFKETHPELRVAYYAMQDQFNMLCTVLGDNDLELVRVNLQSKEADTILSGAGRSIHKIPDSKNMSYTSINEEGNHDVYQFDMESGESFFVTQLPIGIQDHIWLDDSRILIGSNDRLYLYDPYDDGNWKEVANLSEYGLKEITRLALSPDRTKLALAAEPLE